jgi:uncharacterized protein (DUF1501 family)
MMIERRQLLASLGAGLGLSLMPGLSLAAAATSRRLVFIIQRGAADGLGTLIPTGDPGLNAARAALAVDGGTKLDGMFTLHPSLSGIGALYARKQALLVHAVASPYRDRSHFDAQNVLESGGASPAALKSGWLNRLVGMLPKAESRALALAPTIPIALRGPAEVASYAPSALPDASADLIARVGQLYAQDQQLHALWEQALATRNMAGDTNELSGRNAVALGTLAARLMTGPNGARIAMIETTGWDTHSGQNGRLSNQLKSLDGLVDALRTGLGDDWNQTLVIIATEFGRTVMVNGTGGTDHGTASAAMLIGGAVKGGRIIADWPGLAKSNLYEARDLKPTLGLDALITGAVAGHYGIDPVAAGRILFPAMAKARPIEGLIAARV